MSDNFTQIKNELIRSEKLTLHEKMVMMVLLSYGSCDKIYLSQARIAKESCMSRNMVHRAVASLKKGKYISTQEQPDRSTLEYKLLYKTVTPVRGKVTPDKDRGYTCEVEGVTPVRHTSNKRLSNKSIDIIPYEVIIQHLVAVSGKKFSFKSKATRKLISARWHEGHTVDDFIKVIDNYDAKFKGTEFHQYLQPSTLFNGKFDERLHWTVGNATDHRTPAERVQAMSDDKARLAREQAR